MRSFALDHLTVVDTTPSQLVTVAAKAGYTAVCMFLQPMAVLPSLPHFTLVGETAERRETRARCEALGIAVDLVYPFTLAGRTNITEFRPALETAAWIGARAVNVLLYDRDAARRLDVFARFCSLAADYGLGVAIEFYPTSQIPSLHAALALIAASGCPAKVGVNVDLLHLTRSGGTLHELATAPAELLAYAQFCDGPAAVDSEHAEWEASTERLLPGAGMFDIRRFSEALPKGLATSIEVPQHNAVLEGLPAVDRARRALKATRESLGDK